jgi:hypothetical protein
MTVDGVSSYIEQGMLPPMSLTYTANANTVVLTSKAGTGVGSSGGTTFTKSIAAGAHRAPMVLRVAPMLRARATVS